MPMGEAASFPFGIEQARPSFSLKSEVEQAEQKSKCPLRAHSRRSA
jgi:hypothetical protein